MLKKQKTKKKKNSISTDSHKLPLDNRTSREDMFVAVKNLTSNFSDPHPRQKKVRCNYSFT